MKKFYREEVTRDGTQWISMTRVRDQAVIRIMIISYLTEQRHLEEVLKRLDRAAALVNKGQPTDRAIR